MQNQTQIDYDAIIREAEVLRARAIADLATSVAAFFRRKPALKPVRG